MAGPIQIRIADAGSDAAALVNIYAPYVRNTAITYEYDVPSPEDFAERIRHVLEKHPYLVAERDGEILGYAYAGAFISRTACDWSVETSLYVRQDRHGAGTGRALYDALEAVLALQNIVNLYAVIACPHEEDDEHLTHNSIQFHHHMGYRQMGRAQNCGYKFGRWYDLIWMDKHLSPHLDCQPAVLWFPEVREQAAAKLGVR